MAVHDSAIKRTILREIFEANRDNAGVLRRPSRPVLVRRTGLGALALLVLLAAGVIVAALRAPVPQAVVAAAGEPIIPLVPYALPAAGGPVDGVADYARLARQPLVPLAGLFGLEVKTIVIDPGHGGYDPGAIAANGVEEKDVTLDVARRLQALLEANGELRVLLTRETDRALSLKARVAFANEQEADLFISLHVNSLPQAPATVIETYYFGPPTGPETLELAARENADSNYTMAQFDAMIQRLELTFKRQESEHLARAIQHRLFRRVHEQNAGVTNAGVKTAPFVVLLGVDMPAVLAELTCLSNPAEARRLATPAYRNQLARYLEQGILSYLRAREPALMLVSQTR